MFFLAFWYFLQHIQIFLQNVRIPNQWWYFFCLFLLVLLKRVYCDITVCEFFSCCAMLGHYSSLWYFSTIENSTKMWFDIFHLINVSLVYYSKYEKLNHLFGVLDKLPHSSVSWWVMVDLSIFFSGFVSFDFWALFSVGVLFGFSVSISVGH